MKIRAEDGRSIQKTDISMFINDLPNGKDTVKFCTEDASGSTSQAANVVEGIEAGASLLLIDEDTSATNFMIRDELMQRVIHRDMEPITPFIERIRELYDDYGVSTIIVGGKLGSVFPYCGQHHPDGQVCAEGYHRICKEGGRKLSYDHRAGRTGGKTGFQEMPETQPGI